MIDPHQVGPVVDYLHEQKFVPVGRIIENGTLAERGPPQPGLSMKGRTPQSLLAQVVAWHRRLARVPPVGRNIEWVPCGIPGIERVEGETGNQRRFLVAELTSSAQLRAEGAAMSHCVFTYVHSCAHGRSAIFSLQADAGKGLERRLTVEVNVPTRQVVQARGRFNAPATQLDQRVLNVWASVAGLTFSRYALTRAY